jgi:hypothetical protein
LSRNDPPGTFRTDAITVSYVPPGAAETTLATAMPQTLPADLSVNLEPGCPLGDPLCGFRAGMTVVIYNASGNAEALAVTAAGPATLRVERPDRRSADAAYPADSSSIAELVNVVYALRNDPLTGASQLIAREGANGLDVAVVDHVVGLHFSYFGEPEPPRRLADRATGSGPVTTYGPAPPLSEQPSAGGSLWVESCVYSIDVTSGNPIPRLPLLSADETVSGSLVELTSAQLTDGPWCPSDLASDRWDADLLRIRRIAVTVRIESANASLRGPAGVLFSRGGTSRDGRRWLPDREVTFDVSPRNLNFRR